MNRPKPINVLSRQVYNQIAAGEVVERPASVVKELFENAVDAGASTITVSIANGGLDEIFVQDDGCGIEKEDLPRAFMSHATSKITDANDLLGIKTLGFRGEALASIASVSETRIASKTIDEEIGYVLTSSGGELSEITESPCMEGTAVTVSKLFFNTPARLKFLKTARSEESEVTNLIARLILANSTVAVKYYVDDKLELESFGDGLKDAVRAIYGVEALDNCYEISYDKNGILLEGFLGNINYYKGNRTYQTAIVNGRWVVDQTISSAAQNAYAPYLMKRQYPFYILKIDVDPEVVDVNVHPRKTEIRFQDNGVIYAVVKTVISRVLDGTEEAMNIIVNRPRASIVPTVSDDKPISEVEIKGKPYETFSYDRFRTPYEKSSESEYYSPIFEKKEESLQAKEPDYSAGYDVKPPKKLKTDVAQYVQEITDFTDEGALKSESLDDIFRKNKEYIEKCEREKQSYEQITEEVDKPFRIVGQALNTFLILECGDEIIMIDQHAAHERILFDKFCLRLKTNTVAKQRLLFPYAFKANALEADMITDMKNLFEDVGIDILPVGDGVFNVCSLPVELIDIDYDVFFRDILTDATFKDEKMPGVLREKIIQKACKSAIKSGDKLSEMEINSLVDQLKNNRQLKCPHG
ncbi:MAG TPA: DNA mismatch repair endonuclease MutL, partial [Clostridiales bacterium]|nr:DNA mismatch repair endonuclease MutL [Clostridiales bacterium]